MGTALLASVKAAPRRAAHNRAAPVQEGRIPNVSSASLRTRTLARSDARARLHLVAADRRRSADPSDSSPRSSCSCVRMFVCVAAV
ncbi:hypothetical protein F2P81_011039 [Scophthalmus maximus]|uniref:Uncharacterized protein n=1 Tax=Scophthalmus maximus TaxID=52904 RepID=A0A6A4SQS2_SCOMX|nr:hypothetical protein F2P81_011039 [Scophthalmus maximus]